MKLKYLGTAAAEGIPAIFCDCEVCRRSKQLGGKNIRTRSQAVVDDKLLIDFPADTYTHYLNYNFPLSKITSCIITHSHNDHLYPSEIEMRKDGFSHIPDIKPMTFYAGESGFDILHAVTKKYDVTEDIVKIRRIEPFKAFDADGYRIIPLKASHDESSSPFVFLVEKNGKTLFYSNDTGDYPLESWEYLKHYGRKINLVSLDCTSGNRAEDYIGHMGIVDNIKIREKLFDYGVADKNTIFVLNHFSHNGADVVYDDFVNIAEKQNFLVSYDGMEIEF